MAFKILAQEESLSNTTPESISSASRVRLYNNSGSDVLVGRYTDANTSNIIGSITIKTGTEIDLIKEPSNCLMVITGAEVKATKVGVGF